MPLTLNIKQPLHHFLLDVHVQCAASGIVGLFGQSGSGKTSLLRAIAGLNNKCSGNITFNNNTWELNSGQLSNNLCNIGMVFQDSRLFNHLTVAKNLSIVEKPNAAQRIDLLVNDFGVTPLLDKYCHQLSAGQQQRVALVRSLLANPQLLLLDEPLSALDHHAKQSLMTALKNYSQLHKLPMVYVSHHIEEIHTLCDELMLMDNGKIIDYGDCQEVLMRHQLLPHNSQVLNIDENTKQITLQLSDEAFTQLSHSKNITLIK